MHYFLIDHTCHDEWPGVIHTCMNSFVGPFRAGRLMGECRSATFDWSEIFSIFLSGCCLSSLLDGGVLPGHSYIIGSENAFIQQLFTLRVDR